MKRKPVDQRFWSKVCILGPDDCWIWTGARRGRPAKQYGNFRLNEPGRANVGAHVFAWELGNGRRPAGMCVLHRCDVMLCVNPAHLFLGTTSDNNRDMMLKDRVAHGSRHWNARLTEADISRIVARIAAGEPQASLAAALGVSQSTISRVASGQRWRRAPRGFDPRRELDDLADYKAWLLRQDDIDPYLAKALQQ